MSPAEVEALRGLIAHAPEPGNLRRPNAVSAFLSRWHQWRAEAEDLMARLDGPLVNLPLGTPQQHTGAVGDSPKATAPTSASRRRPRPAQVHAVGEEITAARGRRPSSSELATALRARFRISRATAYRAMKAAEGHDKTGTAVGDRTE